MDYFIARAEKLLEAYPAATVSITYVNQNKKSKGKSVGLRKAKNAVKFKINDPESSKCVRYKTHKSKELSKLLAFVGPRGIMPAKLKNASTAEIEKKTLGLAALMSNVEFKEPEVPVPEEKKLEQTEVPKKDDKKKKKGKKGKK